MASDPEAGVNVVVWLWASVALPSARIAMLVALPGGGMGPGPGAIGQLSLGSTVRHSSGASPTAFTWAVALLMLPEVMVKSTSNDGLTPVTDGLSEVRIRGVPAVRGTFVQPAIGRPLESLIVRTTEKFAAGAGLVRVNVFHERTAPGLLLQAMRGTTVLPGKDARVGARAAQPRVLLTMSYDSRLGWSCRTIQMQLGIAGSGDAV